MPFGNVFGAFFFLFCAWLGLRYLGSEAIPARVGGALGAVLAASLSLGLLTRRAWGRWAGVLAAVGMVLFGGWQVNARGTALDFAVVLAALVTSVLLLLPGTAANSGTSAAKTAGPTGGLGRALGWTGALSALSLAVVGATQLVAPPAPEERPPVELAGLPRHVAWSDFGSGVEQARAEGKPLLVTFETSWCGYCKKMDQTTWKHPSVVERMAEMVPVKVDTEDGRTRNGFSGVQLAGQYQISGTPTTMLVDAEGRVLARSSGYLDPRQFLSWLEGALGSAGAQGAGRLQVSGP